MDCFTKKKIYTIIVNRISNNTHTHTHEESLWFSSQVVMEMYYFLTLTYWKMGPYHEDFAIRRYWGGIIELLICTSVNLILLLIGKDESMSSNLYRVTWTHSNRLGRRQNENASAWVSFIAWFSVWLCAKFFTDWQVTPVTCELGVIGIPIFQMDEKREVRKGSVTCPKPCCSPLADWNSDSWLTWLTWKVAWSS